MYIVLLVLGIMGIYLCTTHAVRDAESGSSSYSHWMYAATVTGSILVQLANVSVSPKKRNWMALSYGVIISLIVIPLISSVAGERYDRLIAMALYCVGFANLFFMFLGRAFHRKSGDETTSVTLPGILAGALLLAIPGLTFELLPELLDGASLFLSYAAMGLAGGATFLIVNIRSF